MGRNLQFHRVQRHGRTYGMIITDDQHNIVSIRENEVGVRTSAGRALVLPALGFHDAYQRAIKVLAAMRDLQGAN